jgi:hypothetical protein
VRAEAIREGKELLTKRGFDPDSFWEQPVVWGELDSFQCVYVWNSTRHRDGAEHYGDTDI